MARLEPVVPAELTDGVLSVSADCRILETANTKRCSPGLQVPPPVRSLGAALIIDRTRMAGRAGRKRPALSKRGLPAVASGVSTSPIPSISSAGLNTMLRVELRGQKQESGDSSAAIADSCLLIPDSCLPSSTAAGNSLRSSPPPAPDFRPSIRDGSATYRLLPTPFHPARARFPAGPVYYEHDRRRRFPHR